MRKLTLLSLALLTLAGCSSMEYAVKKKFGIHKRDILVARVQDARGAQDQAKEQFKTALEQFIELTGAEGGELKVKYDKLSTAYERSESRATAVRDRIAEIETVAGALFREWESELAQYSDQSLRRIAVNPVTIQVSVLGLVCFIPITTNL